jgi:hypothetical protein
MSLHSSYKARAENLDDACCVPRLRRATEEFCNAVCVADVVCGRRLRELVAGLMTYPDKRSILRLVPSRSLRCAVSVATLVLVSSSTASAGLTASRSSSYPSEVGFKRGARVPDVDVQQVVRVPRSIPSDGSRNVTKRLTRFISRVPDHSRIVFARRGVYRIEGTVEIRHRSDLVFAGRGAKLKATAWKGTSRTRSQLRFVGGANLIIRGLTVVGANPYAGTSDLAYNPLYEAQHAFDLLGVQGMLLDNVRAYDTWGDFVYIGPENPSQGVFVPSRDVTVQDSRFARSGRMGICICAGEDIEIINNTLKNLRRSVFDIEPTSSLWQVHRINIVGNTTSNHRLLWLANAGSGGDNITDIYAGHNTDDRGGVDVRNPSDTARSNYVFEYNDFGTVRHSPNAPFWFRAPFGGPGVVDIVVRGNTAQFSDGADMSAVSLESAHTVQVYDNVFTGVGMVLTADATSTEYNQWNNRT